MKNLYWILASICFFIAASCFELAVWCLGTIAGLFGTSLLAFLGFIVNASIAKDIDKENEKKP